MKRQLATHKRILKVRETLRRVAIGRAMDARGQLEGLEQRSSQLSKLRLTMFENMNCAEGHLLAARMELGHRLIGADNQVSLAVVDARQAVAEKDRQTIAAHIERDAMRKLIERRSAGLEKESERRIAAFPRAGKPRKQRQE